MKVLMVTARTPNRSQILMLPHHRRNQCLLIVMRLLTAIPLILLASWATPAHAQESPILGSWHGTSTCVDKVKFPACNDEESSMT